MTLLKSKLVFLAKFVQERLNFCSPATLLQFFHIDVIENLSLSEKLKILIFFKL